MNVSDTEAIHLLHHLASLRADARRLGSVEPFDPAHPGRVAYRHEGRRYVVELRRREEDHMGPRLVATSYVGLVPRVPVPSVAALHHAAARRVVGDFRLEVALVDGAEARGSLGFADEFVVKSDQDIDLWSAPLSCDRAGAIVDWFGREFEQIAEWQSGVDVHGDANHAGAEGRRDHEVPSDPSPLPSELSQPDEDDGNEHLSRANDRVIGNRARSVDSILAELDRLIGLEPVKKQIRRLVRSQQVSAERKRRGLPSAEVSPHLVFLGNPGTGKTTVARLVGEVYRAIGLLDRGHVVETDRAGLVGAYIGTTAIKTRRVCKSAMGGVLFVDEAYMLNPNGVDRDYGPEAIATLLAFMENNRGRIAVVAAGYPAEMEAFLKVNPGLASRFDISVNFPDYETSELSEILDLMLSEQGMVLTTQAREAVSAVLAGWRAVARPNFANGREVRNLVQEILRRHAEILGEAGGLEDLTDEQLNTIGVESIPTDDSASNGSVSTAGYI